MQLAWGTEEIAFRDELVAFLDAHTPREMGSGRDYADDGSGGCSCGGHGLRTRRSSVRLRGVLIERCGCRCG